MIELKTVWKTFKTEACDSHIQGIVALRSVLPPQNIHPSTSTLCTRISGATLRIQPTVLQYLFPLSPPPVSQVFVWVRMQAQNYRAPRFSRKGKAGGRQSKPQKATHILIRLSTITSQLKRIPLTIQDWSPVQCAGTCINIKSKDSYCSIGDLDAGRGRKQ